MVVLNGIRFGTTAHTTILVCKLSRPMEYVPTKVDKNHGKVNVIEGSYENAPSNSRKKNDGKLDEEMRAWKGFKGIDCMSYVMGSQLQRMK